MAHIQRRANFIALSVFEKRNVAKFYVSPAGFVFENKTLID